MMSSFSKKYVLLEETVLFILIHISLLLIVRKATPSGSIADIFAIANNVFSFKTPSYFFIALLINTNAITRNTNEKESNTKMFGKILWNP